MSSNTRPIKIMTRFIFEYQCIAGICSDNQAETNPKPKPTWQLPFIVFLCLTPKFSIPQTPVLTMYFSILSSFFFLFFFFVTVLLVLSRTQLTVLKKISLLGKVATWYLLMNLRSLYMIQYVIRAELVQRSFQLGIL